MKVTLAEVEYAAYNPKAPISISLYGLDRYNAYQYFTVKEAKRLRKALKKVIQEANNG